MRREEKMLRAFVFRNQTAIAGDWKRMQIDLHLKKVDLECCGQHPPMS